jgi:hypothetical protein
MVVVVPSGSSEDTTRKHEFYNSTFEYLQAFGLKVI